MGTYDYYVHGGITVESMGVFILPDYQLKSGIPYTDVALIMIPTAPLDNPNIHIMPITSTEVISGQVMTAYGRGLTQDNGVPVPIPQMVDLAAITNELCSQLYLGGDIPGSMLCARGPGKEDTCPGDSGGPLTITDAQGKQYVVGVISWGSAVCGGTRPAVFARLSARLSDGTIISWINKTMADNPVRFAYLPAVAKP